MSIFASEPGLLERFRTGERDALERVYRAYVNDVFRVLRHGFLVGTQRVSGLAEARALEATQEVFVKAFAPAARLGYDGARPYRPFLLRITKNVRIDQLRRAAHEAGGLAPSVPDPAALEVEELAPAAAQPEERLHDERLRQATARYLASLSAAERRFVELRFDDELSQAEVAIALGLTRRRVRTLEQRLLIGLRRHLGRQGLR